MPRRLRMIIGVTLVVVALVVGFALMLIPESPSSHVNDVHHVVQLSGWRVVGLVIAALATLVAFGLGILEAFDATEHPDRHHEDA